MSYVCVRCPACRNEIDIPRRSLGRSIVCPECGERVRPKRTTPLAMIAGLAVGIPVVLAILCVLALAFPRWDVPLKREPILNGRAANAQRPQTPVLVTDRCILTRPDRIPGAYEVLVGYSFDAYVDQESPTGQKLYGLLKDGNRTPLPCGSTFPMVRGGTL